MEAARKSPGLAFNNIFIPRVKQMVEHIDSW